MTSAETAEPNALHWQLNALSAARLLNSHYAWSGHVKQEPVQTDS